MAALVGVVAFAPRAHAQTPIPVANFSFESPTTSFVTTIMPSWQKLPQAADFNPNNGYTWDQEAGVFLNDPAPASDHINNLDGTQSAYIFSDQGVGIYQTLSANYQLGQSYKLTVGIDGQGGGMPDGAILQIQLYYVAADNSMVTLGTTTATENMANFPDHVTMFDYAVNLPSVKSSDAWLGRPIGIEIVSPEIADIPGQATFQGGYWDVDNVRLTAVPEPGSAALLALGTLALLRRRSLRAV